LSKKIFNISLSQLGPGLLYAGAAIGVSHLVQSTRAGASFQFQLLWIIVLVNVLKYPFFETGARYAGATGQNLLFAYRKLGKGIIWFYIVQTFFTMFIIQAVVTLVSAGILNTLIPATSVSTVVYSAIISGVCLLIIIAGRFNWLQKTTKWIVILLTICSLVALILAVLNPVKVIENTRYFDFLEKADLFFLVALIGWMPAPIDISVWQSVWRTEGNNEKNIHESLVDFKVGYIGTALIALLFLGLGALIFYNSGEPLEKESAAFANQMISIYTQSIGKWAFPIVAFAAFATMFTTTLTCLDANPRVIGKAFEQLEIKQEKKLYWTLTLASATTAVLIPLFFKTNMSDLVDFATSVSFVTAPILATVNYQVSFGNFLPPKDKPKKVLKIWSIMGLIFLYAFTLFYLYQRFLS
jgi:Mn2+/Fe2+ NRAMP family transporter